MKKIPLLTNVFMISMFILYIYTFTTDPYIPPVDPFFPPEDPFFPPSTGLAIQPDDTLFEEYEFYTLDYDFEIWEDLD